jgi:NADP-dependent 3-hydroxy acid dehydrogenase YdfG
VNDRADFANGQAFNLQSSDDIVSFRSEQLKENEMSGIKNKVVAITGASSGIGEATALLLAERGAKVVLGARGQDRLAALADRIARTGGEAAYAPTDVKRRDDLSALVKLACERYGKLDVLVNNAGVMPISPLDDLRVEDWEEMIDVNIKGVLYGIAAALPVFRTQKFGHFVNIASVAGLKTVPNMAVYSGTKFAVRAISEGLRQEAGDTLRVTIISPGMVRTNFAEGVTNQTVKAQLEQSRDTFAMPADAIARAIAFAIEQPADVDVNEIVVRPTAQK